MMKNCIFCQIVAGKAPHYIVYEDSNFLGFLTIRPAALGHSLLIPKKHYQWLWEIKEKGLDKAAANLSQALLKVTNAKFIAYYSEGLEVPHAHLHLIPRRPEDGLFTNKLFLSFSPIIMTETAKKILRNTQI